MRLKKSTWLTALAVGLGCCNINQNPPLHAQNTDVLVLVANKVNTEAAGMNLGQARRFLLDEVIGWRNEAKILIVLPAAGSSDRGAVQSP